MKALYSFKCSYLGEPIWDDSALEVNILEPALGQAGNQVMVDGHGLRRHMSHVRWLRPLDEDAAAVISAAMLCKP